MRWKVKREKRKEEKNSNRYDMQKIRSKNNGHHFCYCVLFLVFLFI